MEQLRISENHKYFMKGERPFFWLGDTAWLMLQKLDEEEIRKYFRNRLELGYNVIQTVLIHIFPKDGMAENLEPGIKNVLEAEYWEFCDRIFHMAEEMGIYLGVLPAWGSLVKGGTLTEENIGRYAEFLGKRYQKLSNIIWILGGDVRGDVNPDVVVKEAEILKSYNPERLMTFHPFGRTSSSLWFHQEHWLDFNLFQSGHRRYDQDQLGEWDDNSAGEAFFGEDNWRYVDRDHSRTVLKPTLDGEPSYEGIPQGLHNPRNPFWEEWDVRRYAYWSVFAGAAGHTYGSSAIMQFFNAAPGTGAYGVRENWTDALHHSGGAQMQFLKELMQSVDFMQGTPMNRLLLSGQKERYHRISVFAGEAFIFCYDYMGDEFLLDLTSYRDKKMAAYWMNPESGVSSYIETITGMDQWNASPVARKGRANDWVLVLRIEDGT